MNKESEPTTFQSRRGRSNIDLTIVNNQLLKNFDWEISEDESFSDHIIKFKIGHENNHAQHNHTGTRYIIKEQNYRKFDKHLR